MNIFGLLDGLVPGLGRDPWGPENCPGLFSLCCYQDPALPDGGGGSLDDPPSADPEPADPPDDPPTPDPKPNDLDLSNPDPEKVKKLIEDRNRKGKSEAALKKEKAELEAELAKYRKEKEERERKEKTDLENLTDDVNKLSEENRLLKHGLAKRDREDLVRAAGVDPTLVGPVGNLLAESETDLANEDAVREYFDKLKSDKPKWFVDESVPPAAGGHERTGGLTIDQQIASIRKEIDEGKKNRSISSLKITQLEGKIEVLRLQKAKS